MAVRRSILVVDDNVELVETFSSIFERCGYNVDKATDGLSAVEKFKEHSFDVTLMDIVMPGINGVDTFRRMRNINPLARVILMTAYHEEEEVKTALDEGVYQALYKPVDIVQLIELIEEAVSRPSILIVDDDVHFCQTMARTLELKGYRVEYASCGEEAIGIIKQRGHQIALVDVKMPTMDGLETYLKLKEIDSEIVAIMMTAYRDEVRDTVEKALAADAAACIYKPFELSEVVDCLVRYNAGKWHCSSSTDHGQKKHVRCG